mmetsp:Transcript_33092/g.99684  ORF Transcript_33092/g.99684 Transcript_33092/m.99684 type:complete len:264 (-) Transcript_33092:280-1071(-)
MFLHPNSGTPHNAFPARVVLLGSLTAGPDLHIIHGIRIAWLWALSFCGLVVDRTLAMQEGLEHVPAGRICEPWVELRVLVDVRGLGINDVVEAGLTRKRSVAVSHIVCGVVFFLHQRARLRADVFLLQVVLNSGQGGLACQARIPFRVSARLLPGVNHVAVALFARNGVVALVGLWRCGALHDQPTRLGASPLPVVLHLRVQEVLELLEGRLVVEPLVPHRVRVDVLHGVHHVSVAPLMLGDRVAANLLHLLRRCQLHPAPGD